MKRIIKHVSQIHEFPFFCVPTARKKPSIAQSKNSICVTLCPAGKHSAQISLSKVNSPPDHGRKPTQRKRADCAHTYTEKSGALLEELGKASQLLSRAFVLALSHVTHWCGVLGFHAGWAERDYSSGAIALNREKGNLGMSDKKLGFKSLLLNSTELLNEGEKPVLIIPLVNQAVVLTLATVRTSSQSSIRY